ncbi:MAG: hypothetical protein JOY67_11015 [Hyphomicrobiales bacterium]|nr:hypothetical protein [Hyphomicrobiales bacterium]MBV9113339.1 hypothetical protein [Hyphomicrobiales bacterium]MBV9518632.1 hypothetical protein [Hyphomicrobiales bacterium]
MSTKPFLNTLAAGAVAMLACVASLSGAHAMPIALPAAGATAQDIHSGEAVAPRSDLIQDVHWRGRGWHRRGWHRHGWHGRRWRRHWY